MKGFVTKTLFCIPALCLIFSPPSFANNKTADSNKVIHSKLGCMACHLTGTAEPDNSPDENTQDHQE